VTGGDFVLVPGGTCGTTLAPQETCFVDVAMLPNGFGAREGTLTFTSNAAGSPHRVDLLGTGCRTYFIGNNRTGTTGYYCSP
jgi:hypothetical protein